MLVFIDESGDTGLKTEKGSSRYFVIVLVSFEENEEAIACDQRIGLLKRELRLPANFEFKFNKLNKEQRVKFFEAVLPYSFFYFGIVINKDKNKLYGDGFKIKESFYKYTCSLVFENSKPYLKEAIIIIDGSGSRQFKQELETYLRKKVGSSIIKKVKIQSSHSNNLIQLADMIAGAVHRNFTNKNDKDIYRKIIGIKEIYVQIWPK
jgi:hypothetical protein